MTKEKIIEGKELLDKAYHLEKAILNSQDCESWEDLIVNFRRAGIPNFLGAFDIVKQRFISEVQRTLASINEQIENL